MSLVVSEAIYCQLNIYRCFGPRNDVSIKVLANYKRLAQISRNTTILFKNASLTF